VSTEFSRISPMCYCPGDRKYRRQVGLTGPSNCWEKVHQRVNRALKIWLRTGGPPAKNSNFDSEIEDRNGRGRDSCRDPGLANLMHSCLVLTGPNSQRFVVPDEQKPVGLTLLGVASGKSELRDRRKSCYQLAIRHLQNRSKHCQRHVFDV